MVSSPVGDADRDSNNPTILTDLIAWTMSGIHSKVADFQRELSKSYAHLRDIRELRWGSILDERCISPTSPETVVQG